MKSNFKILILSFLTFFLLNGCGGDDNEPEIIEEEIKEAIISAENINLKDAQIGTIIVENFTLNQNTYNSKLGNLDLVLSRIDDATLSFIVPVDIESGKYNLALDFAENTIDFNITKTELLDTPINVLNNFVGDYVEEINNTIDLFSQANISQDLSTIKANIDSAINDFNNLSDAEKIVAAKFIENNSAILDELASSLGQEDLIYSGKGNGKLKNCDASCFFFNASKVLGAAALTKVSATAGVIVGITVGIEVGLSILAGKKSILLSKVAVLLYEMFGIAYFAQNYLSETTFIAIDNFIRNFKGTNIKASEIANKTSLAFSIKPTYRTLNIEDENSSDNVVSTVVSAYLKLKNVWDNNFTSTNGEIPSFNDNEEQKVAKELSQFSLKITANSENVEVSEISGTAEEFSAVFTNKTDIKQDFSFDVIFMEGDITATTTIDFTIGFDEIFLEKVLDSDNQTGTQGEQLDKPIVVKVVDEDGKGVMGVDVEFSVTAGDGSVSATTAETNSEGFAQTNWKLGDNLDAQTLEASVKDSSGENIGSSPLTFSATSEELELHLEIFDGNNQTGEQGEPLPETLKVYVKDKDGNLIDDITVYYAVTAGGGSIPATDVSAGGFSEVTWTLGNTTGTQTVEATLKDANGNVVSTLTFNANTNINLLGTWFDPEVDGSETEKFGEQCNDVLNNTVRYLSSEITFNNNTGTTKNINELTEYPNSVCTANGWNLGQPKVTVDTETGPFDWNLNGTILTLIFDNGTDPYPFTLQIIDENNIKLISIDDPGDDDIILRRK